MFTDIDGYQIILVEWYKTVPDFTVLSCGESNGSDALQEYSA